MRCVGKQRVRVSEFDAVANAITALAKSNYEFTFSPEQSLAERAIFPYSPSQTNGIEDSRFVQFHRRRRLGALLRHAHRVRRASHAARAARDG